MRIQTRRSLLDQIVFGRRVTEGRQGITEATAPDHWWWRDDAEPLEIFLARMRREAREAGFASVKIRGRLNVDPDHVRVAGVHDPE
jgi:hypothetical protein